MCLQDCELEMRNALAYPPTAENLCCCAYGEVKPAEDFTKNLGNKSGRQGQCCQCYADLRAAKKAEEVAQRAKGTLPSKVCITCSREQPGEAFGDPSHECLHGSDPRMQGMHIQEGGEVPGGATFLSSEGQCLSFCECGAWLWSISLCAPVHPEMQCSHVLLIQAPVLHPC